MLEITGLSKTYEGGIHALDGLDLSVGAGEILAVVGGSGCGKSTLLRLVAGLETPSAGRIAIDGETVAGPHPAVGLVFQEPRLLPWLTVDENVAFGLDGLPAAERRERAGNLLARVGLGAHGRDWPRQLSGGMAQRAALARALAARPRLLLLDEPFSALDALTRADLQTHLYELWRLWRPTMILVTHDIEEALLLADRVLVLKSRPGRIAHVADVDLDRPRDADADAFVAARRRLRHLLGEAMGETAVVPPGRRRAAE